MDELIGTHHEIVERHLGQPAEVVRVPTYDRATLTPGIVHIGLGNFHRGHQAWYLHRLFDLGLNHDWAIIGAGVRATDAVMRDKLLAQDCLTTLIELDPSGKSVEVTGSMIDFVPVEEGNGALDRANGRSRDPHRRADRDRRRLLHRPAPMAALTPTTLISSMTRPIPTRPRPPLAR